MNISESQITWLAGVVMASFALIENLIGPYSPIRKRVGGSLSRTMTGVVEVASQEPKFESLWQFGAVFDEIFGTRPLSRRYILLSVMSSVLAVVLLYFAVVALEGHPTDYWRKFDGNHSKLLLLVVAALAYNAGGDYISLIETRWVLERMIHCRSMLGVTGWAIVDILASGLIISIFILFAAAIAYVSGVHIFDFPADRPFWSYYFDAMRANVLFETPGAISFYSSFLTSLWIWSYVAGFVMTKLVLCVIRIVYAQVLPPIEQKPFYCMGAVLASAIFLFRIVI